MSKLDKLLEDLVEGTLRNLKDAAQQVKDENRRLKKIISAKESIISEKDTLIEQYKVLAQLKKDPTLDLLRRVKVEFAAGTTVEQAVYSTLKLASDMNTEITLIFQSRVLEIKPVGSSDEILKHYWSSEPRDLDDEAFMRVLQENRRPFHEVIKLVFSMNYTDRTNMETRIAKFLSGEFDTNKDTELVARRILNMQTEDPETKEENSGTKT